MSDRSKIEWCDATWNVVSGCTQVSQGCKNCYAKTLHDRRHKAHLAGAKLPKQYAEPFSKVQLHPDRMEMPLHWKKPRRIFVNSMSDIFHEDVPDYFIGMVFAIAALAPQHTFMILTKRPDRMETLLSNLGGEFWGTIKINLLRRGYPLPADGYSIMPLPNVCVGTSVSTQPDADKNIPHVLNTPAAVRFVSCEPLLGPVDLGPYIIKRSWFRPISGPLNPTPSTPLQGDDQLMIHWVICGGESGAGARPMHPGWARSLRDQCQAAHVPFFFKQWGEWLPVSQSLHLLAGEIADVPCRTWGDGTEPISNQQHSVRVGKHKAGRLLDGVEWNEFPGVA